MREPIPTQRRGGQRPLDADPNAEDAAQQPVATTAGPFDRPAVATVTASICRCWPVERTLSWLHQFRRLRTRGERRADLHHALLSLACSIICLRRLYRSL